jgi:hypothetical protein
MKKLRRFLRRAMIRTIRAKQAQANRYVHDFTKTYRTI